MPSSNNKWLQAWLPSVVVLLLAAFTYAYSTGRVSTELETKTNREDVRELINVELKEHAYPISKGELLEGRYDDIKRSLEGIQGQLVTLNNTVITFARKASIKQKSRTTANNNNIMPDLAINPWPEPGPQDNKQIKDLENYRLTK